MSSFWPQNVSWLLSQLQTACHLTAKHLPASLRLCGDLCMFKTKLDFITYKQNQKMCQKSCIALLCSAFSTNLILTNNRMPHAWPREMCDQWRTRNKRNKRRILVNYLTMNVSAFVPGPYLSQMLHLPVGELMKLYTVLPHVCLYSSSLFGISP